MENKNTENNESQKEINNKYATTNNANIISADDIPAEDASTYSTNSNNNFFNNSKNKKSQKQIFNNKSIINISDNGNRKFSNYNFLRNTNESVVNKKNSIENTDIFNNAILKNVQIFTKYRCLAQDAFGDDKTQSSISSSYYMSFNSNSDTSSYSFNSIAKNVIKFSFPTIVFYLLMHLQQTICLSFLGKKYSTTNQEIINGYGVIMLYLSCTFQCISAGIVSGLDTLLPNAWGLGNMKLLNTYSQRSRIITVFIAITFSVFHLITAIPVLKFLGATEESLVFGRRLLPLALFAFVLESQFSINFIILAVVNKVYNVLFFLFLGIILHLASNYLLIFILDWNIVGAGVSMIVTQLFNYSFTCLLIVYYNKERNDSKGNSENSSKENIYLSFELTSEVKSGLFDYLIFVLPNTLLLTSEWMAFEIQGLFALAMSDNDYSVHLILSNLAHLTNTFSCGFSMATAILVAEQIGKLLIRSSKLVAVYSFIIAQALMSIIIILIVIFRNSLFHLFTDNEQLIELGRNCIIYLALFSVVDATQSVMAGAFRGLGKQKIASVIALVQFYFLQTFLSWFFGFYLNKGVSGIWLSIFLGGLTTTVVYFIVFLTLNFDKIKFETKNRLDNDSKLIEEFWK